MTSLFKFELIHTSDTHSSLYYKILPCRLF